MGSLESKMPFDLEDPHKKAQDAIDRAREAREKRIASLPHLIPDGRFQRCSVCRYTFSPDVKPSLQAAFVEHLSKAHRANQKT